MASAVGESEAARAPPPLHEIYDALKRQLGLEGTFEEVFNAACLQLGVPPTGSLHAKGNACWAAMYGVTDYYPDAARPSLLTRLASWRGTGPEAVVAEPVGEEDEVAALRQRIASMQAQLADEEAAEAR